MLELMALAVVGVLLVIGTITDFKTREVPDWLNYAGIAAGVGIHLVAAVVAWDWHPLLDLAFGLGVFVPLGFLMYYGGQWGGGDAKAMMAIGSLLGLQGRLDHVGVAFLINTLFMGALYGIVSVGIIALRNKKEFVPAFTKLAKARTFIIARIAAIVLLLAFGALSFFVDDALARIAFLILAVFFPFIVYAFLFTKATESCMLRWVTPDKLTEGDWINKDVIVAGKRITGPKDLGITNEQIAKLQEYAKKHALKVQVKDGIPFVPSFLLAFIATLMIGNPFLLAWF
ncbi:prepilin peptidase [Candidatus Woesearchaeota archaeon]|nr:prepilin peptidase [Candidatus Woesearchaeota archaeon]